MNNYPTNSFVYHDSPDQTARAIQLINPFSACLFLIILLAAIFYSTPGKAQLQEFPLRHSLKPIAKPYLKGARTHATPLELPFFDDFSTSLIRPDTLLWEAKGGVVVNNTSAVHQPSKGVATLNGLTITGAPYDFNNQNLQSSVDTLTSQPINLAGLQASNVYLSFFWQAQGLGELPESTDSLLLEFKGSDDTWRTILVIRGQLREDFKQEMIAITDAVYFHAAFQFRFRLFGRPSGAYDNFHLDYIYLNKNRNPADMYVRDLAVTTQPGSLLKRYTAMPVSQFVANPAAETADSVFTVLNNLNNIFNFSSYSFTVRDVLSGQTLYTVNFPDPVQIPALTRQVKNVRLNPATLIPPTNKPLLLRHTFNVNTGDLTTTIPSVDLRKNDTISGITVLSDYYAYDDGTAEYGLGIRQRQGKVACKFILNQPDTLTTVRFYFTQLETDLRGQTFVLSVWKYLADDNDANLKESILYQKSLPITYSDTLNKFISHELDFAVAVSDTFYVGWQQSSDNILAIGLDKNTNAGLQVYSNASGKWEQNTSITGSPMIRPVFGVVTKPVGIEDEPQQAETKAFTVFPNPTTGKISWQIPGVSRVEVYDILGRPLQSRNYTPTQPQELNLTGLPAGTYILHFTLHNRKVIRKVVVGI